MEDLKDPARMHMTLVDNPGAGQVTVMFNPTEFEHAIQTNWQRFTIPGLGYQPRHYVNTTNAALPMELFYRALTAADLVQMRETMNFIRALCYPVQSQSVSTGGPPRVLVVWPQVVSMICTIKALGERFIKFNKFGDCVVAKARVEFEEMRATPIFFRDVERHGLIRQDALDLVATNANNADPLRGFDV